MKKVGEQNGKSQYIDCSFIMGSAACVERLWSKVDAIVSKRKKLPPVTLEIILFLKKPRLVGSKQCDGGG